jgi:hypothetical protein
VKTKTSRPVYIFTNVDFKKRLRKLFNFEDLHDFAVLIIELP